MTARRASRVLRYGALRSPPAAGSLRSGYVVPGPGKGLPASPLPVLMAVVGCTAGCLRDRGPRRALSGFGKHKRGDGLSLHSLLFERRWDLRIEQHRESKRLIDVVQSH
jgi:hypothetical protein